MLRPAESELRSDEIPLRMIKERYRLKEVAVCSHQNADSLLVNVICENHEMFSTRNLSILVMSSSDCL